MAKILLGISLVLLIVTAGLGWQTKGMVEKKVAELNSTTSQLNTTKNTLAKTQTDLKKSNEDLTVANSNINKQEGEIADLKRTVETTKAEADRLTATAKEQETNIASLNAEIEKLKNPTPTDIKENPAMLALQTELDSAKKELEAANVAREAMQQRQKQAEDSLVAANQRIQHYEKPIMQQGLSGRVMAVNNGWNFVVVNIGDRQGVTVNSPLLVTRNGQMVARLKITSVEPGSAIADVVGGTMAKGQTVQQGDRVVFAGNRANPTAPMAPAGDAPTAAPGAGAQ